MMRLNYLPLILFVLLQGCFTIPPKDDIVSIGAILPSRPTVIKPLNSPIIYIKEYKQPQTFMDKLHYLNTCMVNYSWGRGWNNKTNFEN